MGQKRKIEIFSAGCGCCDEVVALVKSIACSSCEITVHDMKQQSTARRARELGIKRVPSVVIDGALADCCAAGIDEQALRSVGIGSPLLEQSIAKRPMTELGAWFHSSCHADMQEDWRSERKVPKKSELHLHLFERQFDIQGPPLPIDAKPQLLAWS